MFYLSLSEISCSQIQNTNLANRFLMVVWAGQTPKGGQRKERKRQAKRKRKRFIFGSSWKYQADGTANHGNAHSDSSCSSSCLGLSPMAPLCRYDPRKPGGCKPDIDQAKSGGSKGARGTTGASKLATACRILIRKLDGWN